MPQAQGDEADDGHAEGEVFHAFHGVGVVQGDVHDAGHVAGQQGGSYGHIEQHIDDGHGQMGREGADQ